MNIEKILQQIKTFYQKHTKAVIGAVIAVVVAFGAYFVYESQPKSIVNQLEVSYKGYDGYGTLSYNSEDIQRKIVEMAYKKAGFSKSDAEALANGDSVTYTEVQQDSSKSAKLTKARMMISTVSYQFNKTSDLSNGEKVAFKVSSTSKKSPIKSETKTFKVEGLKKVKTVKISDLVKEYVKTTGFNGYGAIVEDSDSESVRIFEISDSDDEDYDDKASANLKNGDVVTLKVSSGYLNELKSKGKKVDKKTIDYKISGLKELTSISNISDLIAKNETLTKSNYENSDYTTYTLEKQKDYIRYTSNKEQSSSAQLSLVSVYKIISVSGTSTTVEYNYYGYNAYILNNNSLNLDTASELGSSWNSTKDLENLYADLETDGYSEYKESK